MLHASPQTNQKIDQLREVAVFLRLADKMVKNGKYRDALREIDKARKHNPKNLYALAYEERVRSIMAAQENGAADEEEKSATDLDKISNRAIAEAERSADAATIRRVRLERMKREEEETRKREEQQRSALRKKVYDLLVRAREYHQRKEFNRALDEVARIHMIDPSNENAAALEDRIRADQDKALRQAETERKQRLEDEEKRRKEYVKSELERIKKEGEERKRKAEEARIKVQKAKVKRHIDQAKKYCEEGSLDDALAELAFIVVVDPLNEEVIELESNIRKMEEERQAAELERLEREKQEHLKARRETQERIRKQIESAYAFVGKNEYTDALRVISSAYVLDPLSKELQQAEDDIIKLREEWLRLEEEERQREDEDRRTKQEEEMRKLLQNAKIRASGSNAIDETKERENRRKINKYLESARAYLKDGEFESALGEVALAFVIDPFDEEISRLEDEIITTQNRRRADAAKSVPEPESEIKEIEKEESPAVPQVRRRAAADNSRAEQAAKHIAEARRYKDIKDYHKARNELTKAFMLDPLNEDIKAFEEDLQRDYAKQQEELKRKKAVRAYINRANQYLAQEDFSKALEEIGKGLKKYRDDKELKSLKILILDAQKRWKEMEQLWDKVAAGENRDGLSGSTDMKNQYKEALSNYYTRIENENKQKEDSGEPEVIDIEEEIRKVYNSWREEQAGVQKAENEAAVQKHIKEAKRLLAEEMYDDALAEIAFGKMVEDNRKDLDDLEKRVWRTWNEKCGTGAYNPAVTVNGRNEDGSLKREKSAILLRIHLRAAEELAEQKEYSRALDEITKAYCIDPLNDETIKMEERVRRMRGKMSRKKQTLQLIYPAGKAVGHY